ncbi:MAG: CHAT domain-containing protein [Sulfitobacter sp.]
MRQWCFAILLSIVPVITFANVDLLQQAERAIFEEDYGQAIALADEVLDQDHDTDSALQARQIKMLAAFEQGRSDADFARDLRRLDADLIAAYGIDAAQRLETLSLLSDVEYGLGQARSRLTDVQTIRIARLHPDRSDELLFALRNVAVDYTNGSDTLEAVQFAGLFDFFATELRPSEDPLVMEAAATLSIALIRADLGVRGVQTFARYPFEDWVSFGSGDPETGALVEEMFSLVDEALADASIDWSREVNDATAQWEAQNAKALTMAELSERGDFEAAIAMMDGYLTQAVPEDAMVGVMLTLILKENLAKGQFAQARPYLSAVLNFPAVYAAAVDLPIAATALAAAYEGGVEDDLLAAFLHKALEVEQVLNDPNPERRIDLTFQLAQLQARLSQHQATLASYQQTIDIIAQSGHEDALTYKLSLEGAGTAQAALGDTEAALEFFLLFERAALESGDLEALSSALLQLSLIEGTRGNTTAAVAYARQKLAMEPDRPHHDAETLRVAQVTLAIALFKDQPLLTPELTGLLRAVFEGETKDPELRATRVMLFQAVVGNLTNTAEALRQDQVFAELPPSLQADIIASMAEAALEGADLTRAEALSALGFETAVAGSHEHARLTLTRGRIAHQRGNASAALLDFRAVTAQRIPVGMRPTRTSLAHLPYHLSAAFTLARDPATGADLRFHNEMFQIAQLASTTTAGGALNDAVARGQAGTEVGQLLREKQTLTQEVTTLSTALSRARYDRKSPISIEARLHKIRARLSDLETQIRLAAPTLASLSAFTPLRMEDVARYMRPDEVLLIAVSSDVTTADGKAASYLVALSTDAVLVETLPSRAQLIALSRDLRCAAALTDPNCATAGTARTRGSFDLTPRTGTNGPSFDTTLAQTAYTTLFEPLGDMLTAKKRVIIVADQALISMPFHLALKAPLAPAQPLREGKWLIRDHSIEVVPSVQGFVATRKGSQAKRVPQRFLGVGDPLIGEQRNGPLSIDCTDAQANVLTAAVDMDALSRGSGAVRTQAVRDMGALPETRCELREIAQLFGPDSTVMLNAAASEDAVKSLSEAGSLRDFSVISFATHGLVAGEIGVNDSGLVLTPPNLPTARNDGLLTTQEIAALDLDAEFVILSACNTASGNAQNQEGLSGMAAAFLFAGAQSLLVSHWPVYSDAAVDLTTRSFKAMDADPNLARADALRQAMLAVLDNPNATARQSHPAYWAPFMIVGDGLGL